MPASYVTMHPSLVPAAMLLDPDQFEVHAKAIRMQVPPDTLTWSTVVAVPDTPQGRAYKHWFDHERPTRSSVFSRCWPSTPPLEPYVVSCDGMHRLFGPDSWKISNCYIMALGRPCERHFMRTWQSSATPPLQFACFAPVQRVARWPQRRPSLMP